MTEPENDWRQKLGQYLASLSDEEAQRIETILSAILVDEISSGRSLTRDTIAILTARRLAKLKESTTIPVI